MKAMYLFVLASALALALSAISAFDKAEANWRALDARVHAAKGI